jgi:WD40 repeat protein
MRNLYQVGGSLDSNAASYVKRQADEDLYQALQRGEFCYVLNCRQMGKSSLLVQTRSRLEKDGFRCATIDMSRIGSERIEPEQWYKSIIAELWRSFNLLGKISLKTWWSENEHAFAIERLSYFIEDIILPQFPQENIIIFIDEIDSILGLPFSVDDFFAFIRFCYNQRANNPEYKRLTFAIFGVATPSDLIRDKQRTPFNIGTAIQLEGFTFNHQLQKALLPGLVAKNNNPETLLKEILAWTSGQPFLTQKLCQLLVQTAEIEYEGQFNILPKSKSLVVELLVKTRILKNWEAQDEPEHLRTIRDRLLSKENYQARLLSTYQQILQGIPIPADDSQEQMELLLSGLVVKKQGYLQVKNRIYQEIFNLEWVKRQLANLRPYSQNLQAWLDSNKTDQSRLLRGKALRDAQIWSQGKSLSDVDYQFLAASEECDRAEVQQALEAEKLSEVEARLEQERKTAKLQRWLLSSVTLAFVAALGFGGFAYSQYKQAQENERKARVREIEALASSATGNFASDQRLHALIQAIKAKHNLQQLETIDPQIAEKVNVALRKTAYGATEYNRLSGNTTRVWDIAFSPNNQLIAAVSQDNIIRIWNRKGELRHTITKAGNELRAIAFHPDSQKIAIGNSSGWVRLSNLKGEVIKEFQAHSQEIWDIDFHPKGHLLVTGSSDNKVKLWQLDGTHQKTFSGHQKQVRKITFSPNGNLLASASNDKTVKLWSLQEGLQKTFSYHDAEVIALAFHPNGQKLLSGDNEGVLKLYDIHSRQVKTIGKHDSSIFAVAFGTDGELIASGSWDKTVRLWRPDGRLLRTFRGHEAAVSDLTFSPDGNTLVSGAFNGEVKLWQYSAPFLKLLQGHSKEVRNTVFHPDGQMLASSSWTGEVNLWGIDGSLLATLPKQKAGVIGLDFHPQKEILATGSWDETITLWDVADRTKIRQFQAHALGVNQIAFHPNGNLLVSVGNDNQVKLWNLDGTLRRTVAKLPESITAVAFHPDGDFIAAGSEDQKVRVWRLDGTLVKVFSGHEGAIWGVDFHPNGKKIVSASTDGTAKIWEINGDGVTTLTGHDGIVDQVAFHPNGEMVASASWDGTLKLWQTDGREIKTLDRHTESVRTLAFSPEGRWLASGGDNSRVFLWDMNRVLKLNEFAYACQLARDYLQTNPQVKPRDRNLCNS